MFQVKGLDRHGAEQSLFPFPFATQEAAQKYISTHIVRAAWKKVWVEPQEQVEPVEV